MNRIVVCVGAILTVGLAAWAGAKSYPLALHQTIMAGGVELRPGDYKLSVENDKAVLHQGKISAENPVKVETAAETYATTSVVLVNGDGKTRIKEIHLGGTRTRLVFTETQP